MQLREFAGGDKNLFSAERRMQKQKLKMDQQRQKQEEKKQQRKRSNVFNFINVALGGERKFFNS